MKKSPILRHSVITRHQPVSGRHSGVECLEARIAPAAIATPATFSYTDGDGDLVQVQISGKAGSADFLDALGGDVRTSGGDLAQIIIAKPSADFAISFADLNSLTGPGIGDNSIDLGKISGAAGIRVPVIKGIFTADSTPSVAYNLGGYFGTDFSSGGGLKIIGDLVGDGVGATSDIDLRSLGKLASIHFDGIDAGASVQITGKVSGSFHTTNLDGDLSLGIVLGQVEIGHIEGSLTVQSNLAGRLGIGDPEAEEEDSLEEVTIKGSVLPTASIFAAQDLALHVTKNLSGSVFTGGSLNADVGGALTRANLLVSDDVTLDIAGAVANSSIIAQHLVTLDTTFKGGMKASSIVGGNGLNLSVTGTVTNSRISGGTGNLVTNIAGKVIGSQILTGGDAEVTTSFAVENSTILPDGRLILTVGTPAQGLPGVGNVIRSTIGSGSTSATVNIGGRVANSAFSAGTDLDLVVSKSVSGSIIESANDLILDVGTNVRGNRFAIGSDADVTIGGQLGTSTMIIGNNLDAEIGKAGQPVLKGLHISAGVIGSRIETSDGSLNVSVVGPVAGSFFDSGQHATVKVADWTGLNPKTNQLKLLRAGSVDARVEVVAPGDVSVEATSAGKFSPKINAGHDAVVNISGKFGGSIRAANDLNFNAKSVALPTTAGIRVGGDLTLAVTDNFVAPVVDVAGDVIDFRVGGGLTASIRVGGNFVAGTTTAAATVIGGVVGKSTFLHIGGNLGSDDTAPELIFGRGFAGRLEVGGDVLTDLNFDGNVNQITISGRVGPATLGALGDAVADIIVKGKLTNLSTGSLFARTSANGGNFVNALGTITGVIQADLGAPVVGPFLAPT